MSPVAAMVTTPGGNFGLAAGARVGFGFAAWRPGPRRRRALRGDRGGGSVPSMTSEKRKPAATATAPARTISAITRIASLVSIAEKDQRVVRERESAASAAAT